MVKKAATPEPVAEELSRRTLDVVVGRLHPAVLDVLASPRGLDVPAGGPMILDPAESVDVPVDAVVLAVGVDSPRARVALLDQLAGSGAAAVVFKHSGRPEPALLAAAEAAGTAVLAAPQALSWGQLFTLLVTASSAAQPFELGTPQTPLGDLFALANAVAAMVGGATTIEDPQNRVLAYSSLDHPIDLPRQETILGRQVPSEWERRLREAGVFRRLWQSDDVVRVVDFVDDDDYLPRLAVAIRAGGELLGSLWVIESPQPLGPDAERALREAAHIAALHLLRHRTAQDVDRRRRADALLSVLEGREHGDSALSVLGLERGRAVTVIAFDVGGSGNADAVIWAERAADLVAVYCESFRRQASCAASGNRVYALVPADADATAEQVQALAASIVARAGQTLRVPLAAGIGATVTGIDGVVRSRRDADAVLDVLVDAAEPRVAGIDEVRAQVVINRLRALAAENPELTTGRLDSLVAQDATKGTAWVATLRAYFDAFGDMAAAAARVNVHPNTFRYRLRRITEVFELDLDDPDERLVTELQLRFLQESPP